MNSIEEVRQSIKKISQKEATLYEDRLCGRITVDTYDKIANDLKNDKERYEQQLLELTANDKSFELDAATLLVAQYTRELYKSLKMEQKNRFLRLLLSNLKIQQKTVLSSLLAPFASLVNDSKYTTWLPGPGVSRLLDGFAAKAGRTGLPIRELASRVSQTKIEAKASFLFGSRGRARTGNLEVNSFLLHH